MYLLKLVISLRLFKITSFFQSNNMWYTKAHFQMRIKEIFHCVNSLGKEKVQQDNVPSTYNTTNNYFSFIITVYIHASGHSPTIKSSWTQCELQNVLPILKTIPTHKKVNMLPIKSLNLQMFPYMHNFTKRSSTEAERITDCSKTKQNCKSM